MFGLKIRDGNYCIRGDRVDILESTNQPSMKVTAAMIRNIKKAPKMFAKVRRIFIIFNPENNALF